MLLAKLIKLGEQAAHQGHDILRLRLHAVLVEPMNLCLQQSHIFQLINHFLIVFDACEDVLWDQFGQDFFCALNFNVNDPVVVVDLA